MKPQTFNHQIFGELPVIIENGVEWFGATEAATALSFSKPHRAIENHVDEDDSTSWGVTDNLGRKQMKKFINESGLYSLIFGAAKQGKNKEIQSKAKEFKRWVTAEILPTIRKTGGYVQGGREEEFIKAYFPSFSDDTKLAMVLDLKETNSKLKKELESQKPKVLFADAVETSKSSVLVGELAKIMRQNGIDIGQNRLFAWLRNNGYLIKQKGENYNLPTQKSMELGLFEIKKRTVGNPDGTTRVTRTPKVTGKGQIYFLNKFLSQKEAM